MRYLLAASAIFFAQPADAETLAIIGGTVIDGTGGPAIDNAVILVRDGRISCVGAIGDCAGVAEATPVSASGRFVLPGLVDAHVHLGQTGWLDGRPDGLAAPDFYPYAETSKKLRENARRWPKAYICSGVTAAFDVGGMPWTIEAAHAEAGRADGVHMRAAGPLITHAKNDALNLPEQPTFLPMGSDEDAVAGVARVAAMGADAVKVWYLRPADADRARLDAALMAVGAAAREAGLPLIVHATGLREAKAALKAGASMLVHSVFDAPVDDEFLALLRANDATYAPTLVVGGRWTRAIASVVFETPAAIDDPNKCVDDAIIKKTRDVKKLKKFLSKERDAEAMYRALTSDGAEEETGADNLLRVMKAGGRIVVATDAGNPLTLHGPSINWELEAMAAAGVKPADLLVMATKNGAFAMGAEDEFGTIEVGKLADLVFLKEDPRVSAKAWRSLTHVMRGGKVSAQEELRRR